MRTHVRLVSVTSDVAYVQVGCGHVTCKGDGDRIVLIAGPAAIPRGFRVSHLSCSFNPIEIGSHSRQNRIDVDQWLTMSALPSIADIDRSRGT